jgi:hypothetical protein
LGTKMGCRPSLPPPWGSTVSFRASFMNSGAGV